MMAARLLIVLAAAGLCACSSTTRSSGSGADDGAGGEGSSGGGLTNTEGVGGGEPTASGGSGSEVGGAADTSATGSDGGGGTGGTAGSSGFGGSSEVTSSTTMGDSSGTGGSSGDGGSSETGGSTGTAGGSSGSGGSAGTGGGSSGSGGTGGGPSGTGGSAPSCSGEQVLCDDNCIDPLTDDTHCGASSSCTGDDRGESCTSEEACEAGVCRLQCPGAQIACDGACIDPASDETYCGASDYCEGSDAGQACGNGEQCVAGLCRRPNGAACEAGVECVSGICSSFYLDVDGDGYGAESSGMQRVCGLEQPGADYVTNNLDCCDVATNLAHAAQANPDFEVPNWPTVSIPECPMPFDWNCDGVETPREPRGGCAQHTSQASCIGSYADEPACGTVAEFHSCFWNTESNTCVTGSTEGKTLLCY